MIQTPARHWLRFSKHGLSPTALELYGRCPFQYFARQVLGLQTLETPETIAGPSAAEWGELGHLILKLTYQELIGAGYFANNESHVAVDPIISAAAQKAFTEYETENPVGYPLMWETVRETLTELIREVVWRDLEELASSGYVPVDLEIGMDDRLPPDWPDPLNALAIPGAWIASISILRVIGCGSSITSLNSAPNLRQRTMTYTVPHCAHSDFSRRFILCSARQSGAATVYTMRESQIEASFYYIASRWSEGPLVIKSFNSEELAGKMGAEIRNSIAQLATGIHSGQFFMQPGEHCPHCEVAEICRKNHPPSLWRTENDPLTAPHRQLRQKDLKKC